MSAREIAISKALQELEPAVLDLVRMSHLVCGHAEHWITGPRLPGEPGLPGPVGDALLFGIYEIDARIRQLEEGFARAFKLAPAG